MHMSMYVVEVQSVRLYLFIKFISGPRWFTMMMICLSGLCWKDMFNTFYYFQFGCFLLGLGIHTVY